MMQNNGVHPTDARSVCRSIGFQNMMKVPTRAGILQGVGWMLEI